MRLNLQVYLQDLESLVSLESPSRNSEGTQKVADFLADRFQKLGWQTEFISVGPEVGPCLKVTNRPAEHYDVLLLGHMDTVFPLGTVAQRPFKVEGDRFTGPGSADMKAGDLFLYNLAWHLTKEQALGSSSICLLFNPDEEISSIYSRPVVEATAVKADCVLILEAARANGDLVNERKGICKYKLTFHGIAAHAGVDPDKGASAITEFIQWGQAINALRNPALQTTINIGTVTGGTAPNVVPDYVECWVDCRITKAEEGERIDAALRELQAHPFDKRVSVEVDGGMRRPPFNPSEKSLQLCSLVSQTAEKLGIKLGWTKTGGGSDGNITAGLGVPTIDGLGPIGARAHSAAEYGVVSSIQPRFELLYEVVLQLLKR